MSVLLDTGFVVATNPKCRFGAMEVVATVRSHTTVQCYTPVNTDFNPDTVSLYNKQDKVLEISLNGVDWTNSKRVFTYYDHARVQVSLFEPQGGPMAGGTHLLIHGSSFRASEHLKCSWDGNTDPTLKVDATYINYHALKCIAPPSRPEARTPLRLLWTTITLQTQAASGRTTTPPNSSSPRWIR